MPCRSRNVASRLDEKFSLQSSDLWSAGIHSRFHCLRSDRRQTAFYGEIQPLKARKAAMNRRSPNEKARRAKLVGPGSFRPQREPELETVRLIRGVEVQVAETDVRLDVRVGVLLDDRRLSPHGSEAELFDSHW